MGSWNKNTTHIKRFNQHIDSLVQVENGDKQAVEVSVLLQVHQISLETWNIVQISVAPIIMSFITFWINLEYSYFADE